MPSMVWVGGIRMSVSTASGVCSRPRPEQRLRVRDAVDELDVVDLGQQCGDAFADQVVVVGEDDAQRHALDPSRSHAEPRADRDFAVARPAPRRAGRSRLMRAQTRTSVRLSLLVGSASRVRLLLTVVRATLDVDRRQPAVEPRRQPPGAGGPAGSSPPGTSTIRTSVTSRRTATARPTPNIFVVASHVKDERREHADHDERSAGDHPGRGADALDHCPPGLPCFRYCSRTRLIKNTS